MKKIAKALKVIIEIVTMLLSIVAIVEIVKAWLYKRKVAKKAQEYLEDEEDADQHLSTTINVYSPTIKQNKNRIKILLTAIGLGGLMVFVMNVLGLDRD